MSKLDRSAQFAPFAALTGHKEMVGEKERIVDSKRELDDDQKLMINELISTLQKLDEVRITYFIKDTYKKGGKYVTTTLIFKSINEYDKTLLFMDGTKIPIDDLLRLERI